jgi:hypothetical protein
MGRFGTTVRRARGTVIQPTVPTSPREMRERPFTDERERPILF